MYLSQPCLGVGWTRILVLNYLHIERSRRHINKLHSIIYVIGLTYYIYSLIKIRIIFKWLVTIFTETGTAYSHHFNRNYSSLSLTNWLWSFKWPCTYKKQVFRKNKIRYFLTSNWKLWKSLFNFCYENKLILLNIYCPA